MGNDYSTQLQFVTNYCVSKASFGMLGRNNFALGERMKHNLLAALLIMSGSLYAAVDIKPKVPDFGEFINGVGKAIAIANDLQQLGPQFKAFPSKINNITVC